MKLVAQRGRLHFEGFGLSKVVLPEIESAELEERYLSIAAMDLQGSNIEVVNDTTVNAWRAQSADTGLASYGTTPIRLPDAARLTELQIKAIDDCPSGDVGIKIYRIENINGARHWLVNGNNSGHQDPAIFTHTVAIDHEIDNQLNAYVLYVGFPVDCPHAEFVSARITYDISAVR